MPLKNSLIFVLLFFSGMAFGLTEIPKGKHEVQGKVWIEEGQTYLIVNPGTLSQTKLLLRGDCSSLKNQHQSNASLVIVMENKILSSKGEATFIKVKRYLHPAEDLKSYIEEKDFL